MPPQPLSSYRKGPPALIMGADHAIEAQPQLAAEIAKCIGAASEIDTYLGNILSLTLGAEAEVAIAMYGALLGAQPKEAALKAAAFVALGSEELAVFNRCQRWAHSATLPRHRFAHWVWAHSPQIKNAILLVEPVAIHEFQRRRSLIGNDPAPSIDPRIDRRKILVYKSKDITEAHGDLVRASNAIFSLMDVLSSSGAAREKERRWLESWLQAHEPRSAPHAHPQGTNIPSTPRRPRK